jgi:hypothetical protein
MKTPKCRHESRGRGHGSQELSQIQSVPMSGIRVKTWLGLIAALVLAAFPLVLHAQNYSLDWYSIDGGGGTSTGGVYTVTATIGQTDDGAMSGGEFGLVGGFWSVVAVVQTEGAPLLTIARNQRAMVITWPVPTTEWRLQSTTGLLGSSTVWTDIPPPYATNGAVIEFTDTSPLGNKFYRLHKP